MIILAPASYRRSPGPARRRSVGICPHQLPGSAGLSRRTEDEPMNISKRHCLAVAAATALGLMAVTSHAQTYPTKPIRVIVPSSPGGSPDVMARMITAAMSEELGQPMVVETIPGAAGIIGTDKVAKSPADGYTLLYGFNQVATMNPPLYKKLPYHPERDLAPIGLTLNLSYMWIAPKDFEPNTIDELIRHNRAKPGQVNYASTGPGSAAHLGGLLLERMTGTQMTHVPYRSNTNTDLIAGVVQLKLDPIPASIELVKGGKVKVLAVSSRKRLAVLPDVPSVAETVPGYEIVGWQGIWAPAGTPAAIVQRLNAAMVKVVQMPEMQKRIQERGVEPLGTSPKEMADRINKELGEWTTLLKQANIALD
ncbi:Bug family tripartite tricarboxylate transporter substrate binding protein [Piscinibacter sakaiensis]|uniref:Bug family tripartite tricarboxylate transporter substrate binding protein n=1 Tax=Piscinibacter sakaiensis TaxID=1547922 RepID=UPI003AAFB363